MIHLPNCSVWPCRWTKKDKQDWRRWYTKRLKLAREMDEERKARLQKMVPTTQLRLALETEEERRAKNGLDLIWIEI